MFAALSALLIIPSADIAKFAFAGCKDLNDQDFQFVKVETKTTDPALNETVKMAFNRLPDNSVVIYFVDRGGNDKYFIQSGTRFP